MKPGGTLAGCRICGHIERVPGGPEAGQVVGVCPRCNGHLRSVGRFGSRLLEAHGQGRPPTAGPGEERASG